MQKIKKKKKNSKKQIIKKEMSFNYFDTIIEKMINVKISYI